LRLSVDGRDENWSSAVGDFQMTKVLASAEVQAVPSGRWSWSSGASLSNRHFSNSFSAGKELKYAGSVTRTVLRNPARQLNLDSSLTVEAGRLWAASSVRFAKAVTATTFRWRSVTSQARLGSAIGALPFDEQFVIGLERDSDLWLRAHPATVNGRKNASNTSRSFVLTNSDFQKTVVNAAWFRIGAGPFLDAGKSSISPHWLVDTGVEVRFTVLNSVGVSVSYGKSLSDVHHSLFVRQHGL
jgi:hypothetical protein